MPEVIVTSAGRDAQHEDEDKEAAVLLTETEALARIRAFPNETCPIHIDFHSDDLTNPRNWSRRRKWYITGLGIHRVKLRSTFGPLLLAPLSEHYGRSPVYIASWFILFIFQLPAALAKTVTTLLVCLLFQGLGGSAPVANSGGTVNDLWERTSRGHAMMVYGLSSTAGPPFALVVSSYIAQIKGWRWLSWVYMAITGGVWLIMLFTLPETRHSIILEQKVHRLRKQLCDEGYARAAGRVTDSHNKDRPRNVRSLFVTGLARPFVLLFTEKNTMVAAIYNGFIYGVVFLFNEAFPIVFGPGGHGFNTGEWGLSFLGLTLGSFVAAAFHPHQEAYYLRRAAENGVKSVPEARLHQARYAALLLPASLFWFAWTSYPSVPWIIPILASALFGAGKYVVILAVLTYVVDCKLSPPYQHYAASALAAVVLVRNLVGAGFPLFARQMYTRLGPEWASSLLGFLALLFAPIPMWWFYRGKYLRKQSPFARGQHDSED